MGKRLIWVVVAIMLALVSTEIWLPPLASTWAAQALKPAVGSDTVTARLEKRPALAMLGGQFDEIAIAAADARLDKVTFSEFRANLRDARLDPAALFGRRQLVLKQAGAVELRMVVTQEELSRYLSQSVKGVKSATVTVASGQTVINAVVSVGGVVNVAVTLTGRIAADDQKLKFVTDRLALNNLAVSGTGSLLAQVPLLDLKTLPFAVTVRDIVMEDGRVVVTADNYPR